MKLLLAAVVVMLALGTPSAFSETEVIGEAQFLLIGERANTYTRETNLGNLIADVIRREAGTDIAIHHGGGIGGSINKGPITTADVLRALPFGHRIVVLELTGRAIREAIEHGISRYPSPFGGFPQVSGMSFTFNPARPPGERLIKITIGAEPLKLDKIYTVATNDFLSRGGSILRERAKRVYRTNIFIHEALITYIRKVEGWREPVRFAVIADPHIAIVPPDREGNYPYIEDRLGGKMYLQSVELFLEAIKKVNAVALDFVLIPGDLTKDSERYNHEKLLELLPKIKTPTFVVGGNHDAIAFDRDRKCRWTGVPVINPKADLVDYDEIPILYADFWGPGEMPFYSIEVVPGIRLIALFAFPRHYCPREQFFRWEIGEEQRAWLRNELKLAQDNLEFVIVMNHHPIVSHNIPTLDKELFPLLWGVDGRGWATEDKLKVTSILEEFDVPLVLSGSLHAQDIMERNNVWHITTGSPVSFPLVGARFFELDRERGLLHITTSHIDYIPGYLDFSEYVRETLLKHTEKRIERIRLPFILRPIIREALLLAIRVEPGMLFWRRPGVEGSVFDNDPVAQVENSRVARFLERVLTIGENIAINMPEDDNAVLPVRAIRATGGKVRPQIEGRIRTEKLPPIAALTLGGELLFGYLDAGRDAYRPAGHFTYEFILRPGVTFAEGGISLMAELRFSEDEVRVNRLMAYFDELPLDPQIDEIRRIIQLATGWEFEVDSRLSLGLDERLAGSKQKGAIYSLLDTAMWSGEAFRVALESRVHFLHGGISVGEGLQLGTRGVGADDYWGMLYDARNAREKVGHPEWGIELRIRNDALGITGFSFWGELSDADIKFLKDNLPEHTSTRRDMRRFGVRMIHNYNGLTLGGKMAWMRDGALERNSWLLSATYKIEQPFFHSLMPLIRLEGLEVGWPKSFANPASWDRERLTLGVIAGIGENVNLIVEHHRNNETTGGGSVANDEFLMQLVFEF